MSKIERLTASLTENTFSDYKNIKTVEEFSSTLDLSLIRMDSGNKMQRRALEKAEKKL